jgi:ABC-type multidrug transport system fused ATPase/permease subunit
LIRLGQRVRRTTRRSQEALEQLSHLSTEAFTGHRIVKAFATEGTRPRSSTAPATICSAPT